MKKSAKKEKHSYEPAFPKTQKCRKKRTDEDRAEEARLGDLFQRIKKSKCLACFRHACDPDHIKSQGSGGPDEAWNLQPLCRIHHTERHAKGLTWLAEKYPAVKANLIEKGWYLCELRNRWFPSSAEMLRMRRRER